MTSEPAPAPSQAAATAPAREPAAVPPTPVPALDPHPVRAPSGLLRRGLWGIAGGLGVYLITAYIVLPDAWRLRMAGMQVSDGIPRISRTIDGIPGDPLNLMLVGSEEEIARGMHAAGWYPADPITLRSSLRIAVDTVLRRPDDEAPVSNLYVWDKKQDLAYEFPVGHDPRRRHHVRFWQAKAPDAQGRTWWMGSATFDVRVGLSKTTGQITHHIGPDIDAERDKVADDLARAGATTAVFRANDFQPSRSGKNGGGDPYETDGALSVVILRMLPTTGTPAATATPAPTATVGQPK